MTLTSREWAHGESLKTIKAQFLAEIETIDAQLTDLASRAEPEPKAAEAKPEEKKPEEKKTAAKKPEATKA